jgi:hypothetical protein
MLTATPGYSGSQMMASARTGISTCVSDPKFQSAEELRLSDIGLAHSRALRVREVN